MGVYHSAGPGERIKGTSMRQELTVRVGPDGMLNLAVPLGQKQANQTVRVVVETVKEEATGPAMTPEEWARFVASMAGRITDPTFVRHPQGEFEQREEFP